MWGRHCGSYVLPQHQWPFVSRVWRETEGVGALVLKSNFQAGTLCGAQGDRCRCNVVKYGVLADVISDSGAFQGYYAQFVSYFRRYFTETDVDWNRCGSFLTLVTGIFGQLVPDLTIL